MYAIAWVFAVVMIILLFIKMVQRKKIEPKLLLYVYVSIACCITCFLIGMIEAVNTGYKGNIYRVTLGLAFGFVVVSDILMIRFAADLFEIKSEYTKRYYIVGIIVLILVLLPWNFYGISRNEYPRPIDLRPFSNAALVFYSLTVYFRFYKNSMRVSRKSEEKLAIVGFRLIAQSQLSMLGFMLSIMADTLLFSLTDLTGYTPFFYIAWVFAIGFFILSYLGLIMPDGLRRRIEHNSQVPQ